MAIVAGEDEVCVDRALKLIKVTYDVLEPVLDFRKAKDNPILVHPEDDWKTLCQVGADNRRNLLRQRKRCQRRCGCGFWRSVPMWWKKLTTQKPISRP